jgi:hypothetical protein
MDLDALIEQLNTVDSETIRWRDLADCTGHPPTSKAPNAHAQAAHAQPAQVSAAPRWEIAPSLLTRLQAHLGLSDPATEQARISAILEEALETWLQAHQG